MLNKQQPSQNNCITSGAGKMEMKSPVYGKAAGSNPKMQSSPIKVGQNEGRPGAATTVKSMSHQ